MLDLTKLKVITIPPHLKAINTRKAEKIHGLSFFKRGLFRPIGLIDTKKKQYSVEV